MKRNQIEDVVAELGYQKKIDDRLYLAENAVADDEWVSRQEAGTKTEVDSPKSHELNISLYGQEIFDESFSEDDAIF